MLELNSLDALPVVVEAVGAGAGRRPRPIVSKFSATGGSHDLPQMSQTGRGEHQPDPAPSAWYCPRFQ